MGKPTRSFFCLSRSAFRSLQLRSSSDESSARSLMSYRERVSVVGSPQLLSTMFETWDVKSIAHDAATGFCWGALGAVAGQFLASIMFEDDEHTMIVAFIMTGFLLAASEGGAVGLLTWLCTLGLIVFMK